MVLSQKVASAHWHCRHYHKRLQGWARSFWSPCLRRGHAVGESVFCIVYVNLMSVEVESHGNYCKPNEPDRPRAICWGTYIQCFCPVWQPSSLRQILKSLCVCHRGMASPRRSKRRTNMAFHFHDRSQSFCELESLPFHPHPCRAAYAPMALDHGNANVFQGVSF